MLLPRRSAYAISWTWLRIHPPGPVWRKHAARDRLGLGSQRDGDARVWRFTRRRPGPGPSDGNGASTQSEPDPRRAVDETCAAERAAHGSFRRTSSWSARPRAAFAAQWQVRPAHSKLGTGCWSGRSGSRPPAATSAEPHPRGFPAAQSWTSKRGKGEMTKEPI